MPGISSRAHPFTVGIATRLLPFLVAAALHRPAEAREPEVAHATPGPGVVYRHIVDPGEALNMDGGGSSTFWLAGRVMNSPSDGQLRAVGDCLVLMRRH